MRQVLRFESNQPQIIALEFPEGVNVPGQYGPQVRFSLTENRLMYLDQEVAQAIKTLGVDPGQPFTICRRWEKGRKVWWEVEKLKAASGASGAIRAASPPPTPSPASKLEPASPDAANRLVSHAEPVRILPKPAPTPIADSTPRSSGMQLTRTPPVKPSYEEAFRECVIRPNYARMQLLSLRSSLDANQRSVSVEPGTGEKNGMTDTKWTPGPWRLGPINYADIYSTASKELVALAIKALPDDSGTETVANAQLIASAPDLYEALAKYVEHFGDPLKVARPALRKARGESV